MPRIETILVATDGSPASAAAGDEAIELALRLGARLLVVNVVNVTEVTAGASIFPGTLFGARQEAEAIARAVVDDARKSGVSATYLTWEGQPGEAIVAAAESEDADLVVVGTHGRSVIGRLFLGSVSEYVVRHSRVPVMVVRPQEVPSAAVR
ncbi:MAG: universal stress protein [Chloroflexi bacterium]|nr:universal stress protein [Chloroflexota bacterium]